MPIEAIVQRRLYQQVADQLRQLIDDGEYALGDRLPTERELAERMGISRPTIREALIALEIEGRVHIRVGSGIYVTEPRRAVSRPMTEEGPFEVLSAREFIESAVAEEAAMRADPRHVAVLDDVLDRMGGQLRSGNAMIALDREFHIGVADILGNTVVARVVGELFDQRMNPHFERLSSHFEDRSTWRAALVEHRAVRDAIAAHDGQKAKSAMRRHLRLSKERFSQNFSEGSAARKAVDMEEPPGRSG